MTCGELTILHAGLHETTSSQAPKVQCSPASQPLDLPWHAYRSFMWCILSETLSEDSFVERGDERSTAVGYRGGLSIWTPLDILWWQAKLEQQGHGRRLRDPFRPSICGYRYLLPPTLGSRCLLLVEMPMSSLRASEIFLSRHDNARGAYEPAATNDVCG